MFSLCSSASLDSLYTTSRFLWSGSGKPTITPLLTQAFVILAVASFLSLAIGLTDIWLHAAASAVICLQTVWATGSALSNPSLAFGTAINTTECEILGSMFCGQQESKWDIGDPVAQLRGYAVAGN
jgi:hypothetical protein